MTIFSALREHAADLKGLTPDQKKFLIVSAVAAVSLVLALVAALPGHAPTETDRLGLLILLDGIGARSSD